MVAMLKLPNIELVILDYLINLKENCMIYNLCCHKVCMNLGKLLIHPEAKWR